MAELNAREEQALASSIATLMSLAKHSLSHTQTKMATRSAGHLMWLMGIDEYDYSGTRFEAAPPEGNTIDLEPSKLLEAPTHDR